MTKHKKAPEVGVPDGAPTDEAVPLYEPTLAEIRMRAYEIYVKRGRRDGSDLEDWLQAENELRESNKRND
jgi:Protein of unknown function (DUF2934)